MRYLRLILILLVCLSIRVQAEPWGSSSEEERILYYGSDIVVKSDSSLLVTETIRVVCRDINIKHGIYRDFPTKYAGKYGNNIVVGFDVLNVERDGYPEPYDIQPMVNGKRIRIGPADKTLPPGEYVYTITYKATRELGFFKDHDELYWNVTGNGWQFPIDQVEASVTLPGGVPQDRIRLEAYTGPRGARGRDYESGITQGVSVFRTTRPLEKHSGLTIVVGFPKGYVAEPTRDQQIDWFIEDNQGTLVILLGSLAVLAYFGIIQVVLGKDPKKGTIIPTWEAPDGLSPAAVRYIVRMKSDSKAVAAAIVSMAVKKFIIITHKDGGYNFKKPGTKHASLSLEEGILASQLFTLPSTTISRDRNPQMHAAVDSFRETLKTSLGDTYFSTNRNYFIGGALLSAAALVAGCIAGVQGGQFDANTILAPIIMPPFIYLVITLIRPYVGALRRGINATSIAVLGMIMVFVIPVTLVVIASATALVRSNLGFLVCVFPLVLINILFYHLLEAYTKEGRSVLDKIEGLKLYLTVAEKDNLELMGSPGKTLELYEQLLPYAIALDVEDEWSRQFAEVFAGEAVDRGAYTPSWYRGSSLFAAGSLVPLSSFSSSVTDVVSASSKAPGSSSGFSGSSGSSWSGGGGSGGSSGGGGGGGGGGGW